MLLRSIAQMPSRAVGEEQRAVVLEPYEAPPGGWKATPVTDELPTAQLSPATFEVWKYVVKGVVTAPPWA